MERLKSLKEHFFRRQLHQVDQPLKPAGKDNQSERKQLIVLKVPEETLKSIVKIGGITGVTSNNNQSAQVIQDALRTYEWVLAKQAGRKTIASLSPNNIETLESDPNSTGQIDSLVDFIVPDKVEEAQEFLLEGHSPQK